MASIVASPLERYFRHPGLGAAKAQALLSEMQTNVSSSIESVDTEMCFLVQVKEGKKLNEEDRGKLLWLLSETYEPEKTGPETFFDQGQGWVVEVGPRLSFVSAFSTNAVTICNACGIQSVQRIECTKRFKVGIEKTKPALSDEEKETFVARIHDRMTEMVLPNGFNSFGVPETPAPVRTIPVMKEGKAALKRISDEMGLGFDDWDLDFYTNMFRNDMKRDPTDVECFDMAQGNSEHSRHWFFGGKMVIDGMEKKRTLFGMVKNTLKTSQKKRGGPDKDNSVIAFHDNSSAIRGFEICTVAPTVPGRPSPMDQKTCTYHPLLTAETHNFPTGVAPFPGATTGTGGRLRDVMATGMGAHCIAGTAGYCVGNLNIPGYELPWEKSNSSFQYPGNLARPLDIEIEASNGASDYGNKFGEPVVTGFTRSFGLRSPAGDRREWVKPIMFTAGIGQLDDLHLKKEEPAKGMLIVKIGGPCYRIGMGGGAASSRVQDEKDLKLDFDAVQRGDAEMANKVNRVVRACIELGKENPIVSIHDQGAGGNSNVLKEIAEPAGCVLQIRDLLIGDKSLSVLEIWGSEYQENNAMLIRPESLKKFEEIGNRENCPFSVVGVVTGDGRVVLHDSWNGTNPVDVDLDQVLGSLPQKTFVDSTSPKTLMPLEMSALGATKSTDNAVKEAVNRVLRLLSVGSKRFLTTKVDRSVTGLVAQQQCVGPLHTPLADVAVLAQSHFKSKATGTYTGIATSVGEQPIKGLLSNAAGVRMSIGEALLNLVWAKVTCLSDVKGSGNWMWAAKLPGEAANMYEACEAIEDCMSRLGISIDGGKDSLSMAAKVGTETVKSPGTFVLSCYCTCPDVTLTVTPDFKLPSGKPGNNINGGGVSGEILFVDLGQGKNRIGGSALAQTLNQLGESCPDMEDPESLARAFGIVQEMIGAGLISAGHDRSDGGLLTTLFEMAFAGNCGLRVDFPTELVASPEKESILRFLFSEELGFVLEVAAENLNDTMDKFLAANIPCYHIGKSTVSQELSVSFSGSAVFSSNTPDLRDVWESTSFELDKRQADPKCVAQEKDGLKARLCPPFRLTFTPSWTSEGKISTPTKHRVAIIRDEGSNGDREMSSAFFAAGFEPWDVHMRDLLSNKVDLSQFRGIVFVGGFSYGDVLDSAKGWAGTVKFNEELLEKFTDFRNRTDTFSLGICNGCQFMALLGWVPTVAGENCRFLHNDSGRFESRFSTVKICESQASGIWFKDMVGSVLGVWVAHGEGKVFFPTRDVAKSVKIENVVPLRYVDDAGMPTMSYPFNPNGSEAGITSLCSPDGRHLAMMPHPERCINAWQWPFMPPEMKAKSNGVGPWLKMFQNVREWCDGGN